MAAMTDRNGLSGASLSGLFSLRRNAVCHAANAVIVVTLALSLVSGLSSATFVLAALLLVLITNFKAIPESFRNFDGTFRTSDNGITCSIIILYSLVAILAIIYHEDGGGRVELCLKMFLIGYFVFHYVKNYTSDAIFIGVAAGSILACGMALYEVGFLGLGRADGSTNAIRFGMIASLFSSLSLAGLLFAREALWFRVLTATGAVCGLAAAFLSGSRGAIIALPALLLPLVIRVWVRRRPAEILFLATFGLLAICLVTFDVGALKLRAIAALDQLQFEQHAFPEKAVPAAPAAPAVPAISGEPAGPSETASPDAAEGSTDQAIATEQSVQARVQLLLTSLRLFRENPLLGAGDHGWAAEVWRQTQPNETGTAALPVPFNQAHNQYANDLAKGGLVGALAGLALLAVPTLLFLRSKPFADGKGSLAALAGLVTCLGFGVFCLTESVMSLSLTTSIYALLVCYLTGAKSAAEASAG
jgi:O-antigen ligase